MSSMIAYTCFIVEDNERITHGGLGVSEARKILAEVRLTGRQLTIHQGNKMPGDRWSSGDESRYLSVKGLNTEVA